MGNSDYISLYAHEFQDVINKLPPAFEWVKKNGFNPMEIFVPNQETDAGFPTPEPSDNATAVAPLVSPGLTIKFVPYRLYLDVFRWEPTTPVIIIPHIFSKIRV